MKPAATRRHNWTLLERRSLTFSAKGTDAFDAMLNSCLARFHTLHPEIFRDRPALRFIGHANNAVAKLTDKRNGIMTNFTAAERRQQVIDQCKVIAHMATALAEVHSHKAKLSEVMKDDMIEFLGPHTAGLMDAVGDILNGIDAVDSKEDAWTHPIFHRALKMWKQP
jgi:hypothetical protein